MLLNRRSIRIVGSDGRDAQAEGAWGGDAASVRLGREEVSVLFNLSNKVLYFVVVISFRGFS